MNNKAFNVSVSLTDNNIQITKGVVQYDDANLFRIKVMSGGEAFDFTGYTSIVMTILKPDNTTIVADQMTDGDTVQLIDRASGMIQLLIGGQGTLLVGMHFVSISFYGAGKRATTAKFNYLVSENLNQVDLPSEIASQSEWPILERLLASNSLIEAAEELRVLAEAARVEAESNRSSESSGLISTATAFANAAQQYAQIAKDWAAVSFATAIPGKYWNLVYDDVTGNLYVEYDDSVDPDEYTLPAITQEQLEERLAAIDCGVFGAPVDKVQILRGLFEDIPVLDESEMAWATDTKKMYIGTPTGNEAVFRSSFVAQASAPTDTSLLWIDTSASNVIKFFNGTVWVGTANATFA